MPAATKDLYIEQGATFTLNVVWKDANQVAVNLTGYTARMQIRQSLSSDVALLNLTTQNGGITLGGATGAVNVVATPAQTAAIQVKRGVYDLELESASGTVTRLIKGSVEFSREVTR